MKSSYALAAVVFVLGLGLASPAMAAANSGRIANYHLNSEVPGRGVCVRMAPDLPGTGWACLWKSNPLYNEISTLLLQAQVNGRNCNITWNVQDPNGHNLISIAECY